MVRTKQTARSSALHYSTKEVYVALSKPHLPSIDCPICSEKYDDGRMPTKLPECGHICSEDCIKELFETSAIAAHTYLLCRKKLIESEYMSGGEEASGEEDGFEEPEEMQDEAAEEIEDELGEAQSKELAGTLELRGLAPQLSLIRATFSVTPSRRDLQRFMASNANRIRGSVREALAALDDEEESILEEDKDTAENDERSSTKDEMPDVSDTSNM